VVHEGWLVKGTLLFLLNASLVRDPNEPQLGTSGFLDDSPQPTTTSNCASRAPESESPISSSYLSILPLSPRPCPRP
jgi:hypothetical protein